MNESNTISGGTLKINCLYGKRLLTIKRALLSVDVCEFVFEFVCVCVCLLV